MTYFIGLIADFIKRHYKKDISHNLKKYMEVNKFIFSYDYNVAKCKRDFSGYASIVLLSYMVVSLLILAKIIIPIIEGHIYFKTLTYGIFIVLVLFILIINKRLFRFFLGDVGDIKNINMNQKQRRKLYRDILYILSCYVMVYVSLLLYLLLDNSFLVYLIVFLIVILIFTHIKLEKKLARIECTAKIYYKDLITIKTVDYIKKYKPSKTLIQILSNNDLIIIEEGPELPSLIRANEIKYVRIENDLYYIKGGNYKFKENYFKNKPGPRGVVEGNTGLRKRNLSKRKRTGTAI